jgi:peptide/nickel transport system permease protein
VPADPVLANLGVEEASNPAAVQAFRERYGLDKPLPVQYGLFLLRLAHGDLGQSEQSHRAVSTDLAEYIPATAELAVTSILLAVTISVFWGTLAAIRSNGLIDHTVRVLSLVGVSVPTFWLGLLALYLFFYRLNWLPGAGRLDPNLDVPRHVTGLFTVDALLAGEPITFLNALQHLILPAAVLAIHNIGVLTRFTRGAVQEVVSEDYINVARAKGLPELTVVRHILRAALAPVVTVIGFIFADVMTGTILVETIFGWPGIGRYAFHAATTLDLPAILGVTVFVVVVFVTVNLVVDVLYTVIDPRLRTA